jgi:hypothetical protein
MPWVSIVHYDHESHATYALLLTSSYCLLEFAITRVFTFTTKYQTAGIDQTDLICAWLDVPGRGSLSFQRFGWECAIVMRR